MWIGISTTFVLARAIPVFLAGAAILGWRLPADELAHPPEPAPDTPKPSNDQEDQDEEAMCRARTASR